MEPRLYEEEQKDILNVFISFLQLIIILLSWSQASM